MPSTSQAQSRYMHMADSAKGRAKLKAEGKEPPPKSVAHEFVSADRGKKTGLLPEHAKRRG